MKRALLAALLLAFPALPARAEILIYDLSFNTAGPSVNYDFLEGGYLVVDAASNAVTSVVILTDPTTKLPYYTTGVLAGTYMEMISEGAGGEYAVITSSSSSGADADNIAFQILGKTSKNVDIGSGNKLSIARKLRGYLLASAAESTSLDDASNTVFSYGFAGASKVSASLQDGLTNKVNNDRLEAASALELLTTELENRGVQPEASPSPTASATASPTASATATVTTSS